MLWNSLTGQPRRGAVLAGCVGIGVAGLVLVRLPRPRRPLARTISHTALSGSAHDPVGRLQERIERGEVRLHTDSQRGYLASVLRELHVPVSSQMLVFSRTSFQRLKISPQHPRALYFSDDVYVGWVPHAPLLECVSVDPQTGPTFYTLSQDAVSPPRFTRAAAQCASCHNYIAKQGVPSLFMLSVFVDRTGEPVNQGKSITTDLSPMRRRWGGWYVTGTHGRDVHMGNVTVASKAAAGAVDLQRGSNVTDLRPLLDTKPYLGDGSDLIALMVLGHQTRVQNLLTELALGGSAGSYGYGHGIPQAVATSGAGATHGDTREELARALVYADEVPLRDPIRGTSRFAAEFAAGGPRDARGRSLRQLDLHQRLFRFPCSYMIYSRAFDALSEPVRATVYRRIAEILSGRDRTFPYAVGSRADRLSALEILRETKPEFARLTGHREEQPETSPRHAAI